MDWKNSRNRDGAHRLEINKQTNKKHTRNREEAECPEKH